MYQRIEIINVGMLYLCSKYIVRVTIVKNYQPYYYTLSSKIVCFSGCVSAMVKRNKVLQA